MCYKYSEIGSTETTMKSKCEGILTGQLGGEAFLPVILNPVDIFEMKGPGCTQIPGCKLSKRYQDVLKT